MKPYSVTFGQRYAREPHPRWAAAHPDGWLVVWANDWEDLRTWLHDNLDGLWAFEYEGEAPSSPELYSRGVLAVADTEHPLTVVDNCALCDLTLTDYQDPLSYLIVAGECHRVCRACHSLEPGHLDTVER